MQQRLIEIGSGEKSNRQQEVGPNMEKTADVLPLLKRSSYPYDSDATAYDDDSREKLTVRPRWEHYPTSRDPDPTSHPEVLPSLHPESYTVTEAFPNLFINRTFQQDITDFYRTNLYALWYHQSPRRWIRLTISVTLTVESRLWNTAKAGAASGDSAEDLPGNLARLLEEFLRRRADLKQDLHLQAYLGGRSNSTLGTQLRVADQPFQTAAYLRDISSSLRHLCRQYYPETALTQFPLYRRRRKCFYLSGVESVWALDFRFGSTKAEIDASLYHLRALHCLGDTPGICAFMGVVADHEDSLVKGFLVKAPLKGPLFRQISLANRSNKPISWTRREKWCRQITRAVAQVHSKGYAVGRLATETQWPFALDEDDNAVLFWLTPTFSTSRTRGTMPPEHRHLPPTAGFLPANCYTDLYQLGLLLWRIATHMSDPTMPWCRLAGCTAKNGECREPHSEPVRLPPTGPEVPDYFDEIISACREENPHLRPPAAQLLDVFPAEAVGTRDSNGAARGARPQQLREIFEMYENIVFCDACGNMCPGRVYHCLVCYSGNYDLCLGCFSRGEHCLDPTHYLQELLSIRQDYEFFYSSVQEDRRRRITRGFEK